MPSQKTAISRRRFVHLAGLSGAAFTLGFHAQAGAREADVDLLTDVDAKDMGISLTAWITIDKEGVVTLWNHRSEMGQGSYQSVPQIIAEELEVDMSAIRVAFAPGFQGKYGSQVTGGSSTIRDAYKRLLQTSAAARMMLITAAANQWKVSPEACYAASGEVIHKAGGQKLSYGALAEAASKLTVPKQVALKPRSTYKLIGKPLPRLDTPMKVNGSAVFGLDLLLPGMQTPGNNTPRPCPPCTDPNIEGLLIAMVERSPTWHGKVKGFNEAEVKALPGVKAVFKVTMPVFGFSREGVAIVTNTTWQAIKARKVLKVEWDNSGIALVNSQALQEQMMADLKGPGNHVRSAGNPERSLKQPESKTLEAYYELPYQSHSCMEPLNCVAHYQDKKVEVWGPIQAPDWVQSDLADRLGMKADQITVNMTFLGGGFGRKAFTDYTAEAVYISKEVKAPVKVIWTREDDMTQGPFRPGAIFRMEGAVANNRISALRGRMAGQNMNLQDSPRFDKEAFNDNTLEGFCEPYMERIANYSFSDVPTETPIPVMWWRSVYASTNSFAYESFIDELAHAAERDPLEFRRAHLPNDRHRAILDKLAEMTDWKKRPKQAGYGIAISQCFGSIVGEVVKVGKSADGSWRVEKVWAVMDCGWYVNPDIIRQQVEGSIWMAYGAAMTHATHFENGMAVERNFDRYNMPRIGEIGAIEVHIMENEEKAGGVGEPALPPFAPALCNAIFDATGKRIRKLPFSWDELA